MRAAAACRSTPGAEARGRKAASFLVMVMLIGSALAIASIAGLVLRLRLRSAQGFPHVDDVLETTLLIAAHVAFVRSRIPREPYLSTSLMTGGETPNIATAAGTRRKAFNPSA
jgi:hypothetical protein